MIVQIYTAQGVAEALDLARRGVDHVGVTPAARDLPGEIDYETARAIVNALRSGELKPSGHSASTSSRPKSVALTVETHIDPIVEMAHAVQPDILHFCPLSGSIEPQLLRDFRRRFPDTEIMYAVSVTGPAALDDARRFEGVSDWFILDTQAPDIPGVGASGAVHDWSVSRRIVEESSIPVILAGGLSPDNVGEAIRTVRPAGVDSLTHTNRTVDVGRFEKDLGKVESFVTEARRAAQRLGL
jgi:phosphoribosylanthranilate isomerase